LVVIRRPCVSELVLPADVERHRDRLQVGRVDSLRRLSRDLADHCSGADIGR